LWSFPADSISCCCCWRPAAAAATAARAFTPPLCPANSCRHSPAPAGGGRRQCQR
jgi:hypothetical protein